MDINEALQVVNSLFDYLSEIGELDKEDFHRMNEAEDVINEYVRKTAAAYDYAVVLEHPEEISTISKEQIEQFKEELNEAQYIIYDKFGMPKQEITFKKEGVVN